MILPPHILNYKSGLTAGQFEEDVFWLDDGRKDKENGQFILPTAETALVNLYRMRFYRQRCYLVSSLPIRHAIGVKREVIGRMNVA